MSLKRIRLEQVKSRTAPTSDRRHYYVFQASISDEGRLEKRGYAAVCHMCKVNKFEPTMGHLEGRLVMTDDGWSFACTCKDEDNSINVEKLGAKYFAPGEFVSLISPNGEVRLFRVVSVDPVYVRILH